MAVTNRYRGDTQVQVATASNNTRIHLRTVNDDSAVADRAFEVQAGQSIDFYYRWVNVFFGLHPNKVTIEVRVDNTNTVIRTYQTLGAEPVNGAAFTFWATHDGTQTGTPRAAVVRLYGRFVRDNGTAAENYDVDTDGTITVSPAGATVTIHSGCLRSNAVVSNLTVSAYPAASTFARNDTITLTATHTQRYLDNNVETVRMDLTTAADVQLFAGTAAEATGTSFAQNFSLTNAMTAGATNYGCRFLPVGNAAFVPTSGAIPWTVFVASGANVTQDGNNVKRSSFYTGDPRITRQRLFQLDDNTFATPPGSKNVTPPKRLVTQGGYITERFVNARGEGISETLTYNRTLTPTLTGTQLSEIGITTGIHGGEAGWGGTFMAWQSQLPGGTWTEAVTITAPATAMGASYLLNSSDNAFVLLAVDPRVRIIASIGPTNTGSEGRHIQPGDALTASATAYSIDTRKRLAPDANSVELILIRRNVALERFEYLQNDGVTWVNWSGTDTAADALSMTDAGDGVTFDRSLPSTAGWSLNDIVAVGVTMKINDTPYHEYTPREIVSGRNPHDRNIWDPTGMYQ